MTRIEQLEMVALFSHRHFGRVLAARWIGLPVEQGQTGYWTNHPIRAEEISRA